MQGHQGEEAEVHRLSLCALWILVASFGGRLLQSIPYLEEVFGEGFFRQRLVVDLNSFPDKTEMWAGVQSDAGRNAFGMYAGLCRQILGQDGRDEGGSTPLALGASNVNRVQLVKIGWLKFVSVLNDATGYTTHTSYPVFLTQSIISGMAFWFIPLPDFLIASTMEKLLCSVLSAATAAL